MTDLAQKPSFLTKTGYGFGSTAVGITETGFNYFLLIYYSQVIGLDSWLVGVAVTIALLFDALSDPIVGYWSDNLRSRWGRRHPFIYASAIPIAASYLLLWNAPLGWSQMALFWYVLLLCILIRTCVTLFETPSSALTPELSSDYDERSSILGFRLFFGWAGSNVMTVLMFAVIFPSFVTAVSSNGQFNADAYSLYGIISGLVIIVAIFVCGASTHRRIPTMRQPPAKRDMTVKLILKEMVETLSDRSFFSLFFAFMLGSVATGLNAALTFYFTTYFWGFTSEQIGLIVIGVFVSSFMGAALAPLVTRKLGKKRGAIIIGLIAFLGSPLPIVLRLFDVLPANGDPSIFWIVFSTNTIDVGLIICFQILLSSMVADLVEKAELRTGRRNEGVFFAAVTFVRKTVLGLGLLSASLVLTLSEFPVGAQQGQVSAETLSRLGAYYVPTILAFWLSMIAVISTYRITREDHEDNLMQLANKAIETIELAETQT